MATRQPVLLTVLIESAEQRWYAVGIDFAGGVTPLIRSETGNLAKYIGQEFDEQVSFLRHRLSGVLQRGCDRLWGRDQKPAHIVFVVDHPFPDAAPELTRHVADHFVEWMTNPPVVFLLLGDSLKDKQKIAGDWPAEAREAFDKSWAELTAAQSEPDLWEVIETRQ